jgi:hypothetical protein
LDIFWVHFTLKKGYKVKCDNSIVMVMWLILVSICCSWPCYDIIIPLVQFDFLWHAMNNVLLWYFLAVVHLSFHGRLENTIHALKLTFTFCHL